MLESQKKKKEVEETRLPGFKPTTLKFSGRQAGALTPALQLQTWPTWLPQTRIFKIVILFTCSKLQLQPL